MPSNEKIAIAAHLHVLLRRKTGRVTDTEWMAGNLEYAAEIARFARERAVEDGHPDLAVWADRLEEIMAVPDPKPRLPLVQMVSEVVKERSAPVVAPPQQPDRQAAGPPERALHRHRGRGLPGIGFYRIDLRRDLRRRGPSRTQAPRPERAALCEEFALVRRLRFPRAVQAVRQHVAGARADVGAGFFRESGYIGWPALSARMLRRTCSRPGSQAARAVSASTKTDWLASVFSGSRAWSAQRW